VFANEAVSAGLNNLLLTIPLTTQADTTYARFRFATYGGLSYTGAATNGEVEDYRIVIADSVAPNLTVQTVTVATGQSVCYNAVDSLKVAGFSPIILNTNVTVNSGGVTTFIAGHVILFQNGFKAYQGSIVNAYITTDSTYCNGYWPYLVSNPPSLPGLFADQSIHPGEDKGISIFPNPTTGRLTIVFQNDHKEGMIRVMNFQGAKLYQANLKNQQRIELDISHLPSGIYLVMIQTDGKVIGRKIVKY